MRKNCPFCSINEKDVIVKRGKSIAFFDKYPVSNGHLLIIPQRHLNSYFECSPAEKLELWELVDEAKKFLDKNLKPSGYNIGINIGESAGQTVDHLHIHLIPRYKNDIDDPKGGVRGVIPKKRIY